MGEAKKKPGLVEWVRHGWGHAQLIDTLLSWWERIPWPMRRTVQITVAVLLTAFFGALASVGLWLGHFATDYGSLALLGILAGAGAATILGPAVEKAGEAIGVGIARRKTQDSSSTPAAPPLSDEDRRAIQGIRALWNEYGTRPAEMIQNEFQKAAFDLDERRFWSPLLGIRLSEWQSARDALRQSLDSSSPTVGDVARDFNRVWSAYHQMIVLFAQLVIHNEVDVTGAVSVYLSTWRGNHFKFREKLNELLHDPEVRRLGLHNEYHVFNQGVADFIFKPSLKGAWVSPPPQEPDADGSDGRLST